MTSSGGGDTRRTDGSAPPQRGGLPSARHTTAQLLNGFLGVLAVLGLALLVGGTHAAVILAALLLLAGLVAGLAGR